MKLWRRFGEVVVKVGESVGEVGEIVNELQFPRKTRSQFDASHHVILFYAAAKIFRDF